MAKYSILEKERNMIEALYFEKNAKEHLLSFICSNPDVVNKNIEDRIYQEAVQANIAYRVCFDEIVAKYVPKLTRYKNASIDFIDCELLIEEA